MNNSLLVQSFKEIKLEEQDFLNKHLACDSQIHGTPYLAEKLKNMITCMTFKTIPHVKDHLKCRLRKYNKILHGLSDPIIDKKKEFMRIASSFCEKYVDYIEGNRSKVGEKDIIGGARICYIFHNTFLKHLDSLDALSGLNKKTILTAVRNSTVIEGIF